VIHVIARCNDGGPVRVIREIARGLPAPGWRHTVLAGHTAEDEPDVGHLLETAGAELVRIPSLARRIDPVPDCRALWRLRREVLARRPDLIHTHTAKGGQLGRALAWLAGLPCLHTFHGHVLHGYFGTVGSALSRALERAAGLHGHLQALTPFLLRELRDRYRIGPRWRWHCLPIPVAVPAPASAPWHEELVPDLPVLGFVGRLAPVKDPLGFLAVAEAVAREVPLQVLICGDGELAAPVRKRADAAPFPCRMTGFVEPGSAYPPMTAMLITSRNEGLPLTLVEAAGNGVPVVAPAVGGLRDCGDGAIITRRRVDDLATAIRRLLVDPAARETRIAVGRHFAARFAPARIIPRYGALYARLSSATA